MHSPPHPLLAAFAVSAILALASTGASAADADGPDLYYFDEPRIEVGGTEVLDLEFLDSNIVQAWEPMGNSVWRIDTGELLFGTPRDPDAKLLQGFDWPNKRALLVDGERRFYIHNIDTGEQWRIGAADVEYQSAYFTDGGKAAFAFRTSDDSEIRILDTLEASDGTLRWSKAGAAFRLLRKQSRVIVFERPAGSEVFSTVSLLRASDGSEVASRNIAALGIRNIGSTPEDPQDRIALLTGDSDTLLVNAVFGTISVLEGRRLGYASGSVALSPDSKKLILAISRQTIASRAPALYDAVTGAKLFDLPYEDAGTQFTQWRSFGFSADGARIYMHQPPGAIQERDATTGALIRLREQIDRAFEFFVESADGATLFAGGGSHPFSSDFVRAYNRQTGQLIYERAVEEPLNRPGSWVAGYSKATPPFRFSPDFAYGAFSKGAGGVFFDARSNATLGDVPAAIGNVRTMAFASDRGSYVLAYENGLVEERAAGSLEVIGSALVAEVANADALAIDRGTGHILCFKNGSVQALKPISAEVAWSDAAAGARAGVGAPAKAGTRFVSWSASSQPEPSNGVYDTTLGELVFDFSSFETASGWIALSPDGEVVGRLSLEGGGYHFEAYAVATGERLARSEWLEDLLQERFVVGNQRAAFVRFDNSLDAPVWRIDVFGYATPGDRKRLSFPGAQMFGLEWIDLTPDETGLYYIANGRRLGFVDARNGASARLQPTLHPLEKVEWLDSAQLAIGPREYGVLYAEGSGRLAAWRALPASYVPVAIEIAGSGASLSFDAKPGRSYFVETSEDLASWTRSDAIEPAAEAKLTEPLDASAAAPAFARVFESAE